MRKSSLVKLFFQRSVGPNRERSCVCRFFCFKYKKQARKGNEFIFSYMERVQKLQNIKLWLLGWLVLQELDSLVKRFFNCIVWKCVMQRETMRPRKLEIYISKRNPVNPSENTTVYITTFHSVSITAPGSQVE